MKRLLAALLAAVCVLGLCACQNLTEEEQALSAKSDDGLYDTVIQSIYQIEEANGYDVQATLDALSKEQKVVYILDIYDLEMQNGGLCQFMLSNGVALADQVGAALKTVGAKEHKKLYEQFLKDNKIDADALAVFAQAGIGDYENQYASYPFEAFDEAYYDLPLLHDLAVAYIRENISAFV